MKNSAMAGPALSGDAVGVVGVGRMGLPIALGLSSAGVDVRVWDTDAARRRAASAAGLSVTSDAHDVAVHADVLLTVLPDAAAVADALVGGEREGEAGALAVLRADALWIDCTSNDPREATEMAERARAAGISSVAAPMGGDPVLAERGELTFYLAGETDAVTQAAVLLAPVAASVVPVGEKVSAAHAVKLLANLLWFGQAVAVTEAMLLGTALGVDVDVLHRVLAGSAGGSAFIARHLPALLDGDYLEQFGIDGVVAELDVLSALARDAAVPFALSDHVAALHREALERFGPVGGELLVAKLVEERAGRTLAEGRKARAAQGS